MGVIKGKDLSKIQSKIKFLLTIAGISSEEACAFLDITKQTLNNIENNKVSITLPQVMALDTLLTLKSSYVHGLDRLIEVALDVDVASWNKGFLSGISYIPDSPHADEYSKVDSSKNVTPTHEDIVTNFESTISDYFDSLGIWIADYLTNSIKENIKNKR